MSHGNGDATALLLAAQRFCSACGQWRVWTTFPRKVRRCKPCEREHMREQWVRRRDQKRKEMTP